MGATTFGADPVAAGQLAGELNQIRTAVNSLGSIFNAYDGLTGSSKVERALDGFFNDSSDCREKLDKLLERAGGMLTSLVDGLASVDQSLVDALSTEAAE